MKKWIACLLTVAIALNLVACNPNDVSSEEIRETAEMLQQLADEMDIAGIASIDLADLAEDAEAAEDAEEPQKGEVVEDGYDTYLQDAPCSPGDDFYSYVNYDWLRYETVPTGYSKWGVINKARRNTDMQIKNIILDAAKNVDSFEKGSAEYNLGALYETMNDFEARNETGLEPIRKYIDAFDAAKTIDELVEADLKFFEETGGTALFGVGYTIDLQDSSKYDLCFEFCSGGTPGKEIMTDPDMESYKDAYLTYLGQIFRYAGYDKIEAALKAASAFGLLKEWEQRTFTLEECYNPHNYVIYSRDELIHKFKGLPIEDYLCAYGVDEDFEVDRFCTLDTKPLEYLSDIFDDDHIEMFRNIMITRLLSDYDLFLDENMFNISREYSLTVSGLSEDKDRETLITGMVADTLPTDLGKIYVKEYSSPEIKEDITGIIYEVLDAYHDQINECEWMSQETKEKAIEKLDKMGVNAVYPDKWIDYVQYAEIKSKADNGTLFDNLVQVAKSYNKYFIDDVKKTPNKTDWITYPQVTNAFYDPNSNCITICAAILQDGIYDINADAGTNLGGIGAVIGHEVSHAFDVNGAQYDADGNVNDWWTQEDYEKYDEICNKVIDVYSKFEIIPGSGLYPDGNLTLGENMADLSGMQVVEKLCNNDVELFKKACLAEAKVWGSKCTPDKTKTNLKIDTHSPGKARATIPLQMCDLFYEAFDIKPGDNMYVEKENRIKIW